MSVPIETLGHTSRPYHFITKRLQWVGKNQMQRVRSIPIVSVAVLPRTALDFQMTEEVAGMFGNRENPESIAVTWVKYDHVYVKLE